MIPLEHWDLGKLRALQEEHAVRTMLIDSVRRRSYMRQGFREVNTGDNKFCGPAVLSLLTGQTTDTMAIEINITRGKPQLTKVTGAYSHELIEVLRRYNFETKRLSKPYVNGSLYWVLSILEEPGWYIVTLPGHFVTIEIVDNKTKFLCDNHTKHQINAAMSARLQSKVIELIKVTKGKYVETYNLWAREGLGL